MNSLEGWKLIKEDTGRTIMPGVELLDFRGEEWRIDAISRSPEGNSTGRVTASRPWQGERPHWAVDRERDTTEVFPSVFGLKIVKDVPQAEQELFAQLGQEMDGTAEQTMKAMTVEALEEAVRRTGHSAVCITHNAAIGSLLEAFSGILGMAVEVAYEYGRRNPNEETANCE